SSVLGPTLAALVIGRFGTASLFFYTATIHVALAAFTVVRVTMSAAPPAELKDRFEALPQQGTPAEAELDPRAEEKAA
ncbi:MAG: MFS transporter, partial [Alphaproteobacteria bacterium]|nr:MFS transporter [Alphaproteobacteria bacterium]